jgi:hypothetical protein
MSQQLQLQFNRDTDGTGELVVYASRDRYSGAAAAWFSDRKIEAFGRALIDSFPLNPGSNLRLEGGYWKSGANPPELEQVLVGICVYPVDAVGAVGIRVELREGKAIGLREESRARASFEILTSYEPLQTFGYRILNLLQSTDSVAHLPSDAA